MCSEFQIHTRFQRLGEEKIYVINNFYIDCKLQNILDIIKVNLTDVFLLLLMEVLEMFKLPMNLVLGFYWKHSSRSFYYQ